MAWIKWNSGNEISGKIEFCGSKNSNVTDALESNSSNSISFPKSFAKLSFPISTSPIALLSESMNALLRIDLANFGNINKFVRTFPLNNSHNF